MLTGEQRLARLIPTLLACGGLMVASLQKHHPQIFSQEVTTEQSTTQYTPRVVGLNLTPIFNPKPKFHDAVRPLADLISRGEGDWNAVNRGYAGDSPGGLPRWFGRSCESFTIQEILDLQASGRIYAVGRYQFIPSTLRYAVRVAGIPMGARFNPEIQNRLFAALLEHKRPVVAEYLRGEHDNLHAALVALAKEWASIEYRNGYGYHDHIGGNRAHITRVDTREVLNEIRDTLT